LTDVAAVLRALTRVTAAMIVAFPGSVRAQAVRLEVRPRAGDTMSVHFEHSLTVSAAPRTGQPAVPPSTTVYRVMVRDVVERVTARSATILSIVDSVSSGTANSQGALFPDLDRSLQGARIRLAVTTDGGSTLADGSPQLDPDVRALIGEGPAVLPTAPVAVGGSWTRDLPLPVDGPAASPASIRTTFHLDSLTDGGNLAWISLTGTVGPAAATDTAPRAISKASLTGSLLLDRGRGWLLQSRTTVNAESVVSMPGGGDPLVVRVRVVQAMTTTSARK
jgi:hypothetical protein